MKVTTVLSLAQVHNPNLLKSRSVDHRQLVVIFLGGYLLLGLFVDGLTQVVD